MVTINNPVLSGFYPDPSICRAGEDFYLVNSSFAYFPGVPIFHSRDLAHWEQIGNILNRESQIPLTGCRFSGGIYAPSIRFHEGLFYMVTTNVTGGGNFYVTATDPAGPWSEPCYLGEAAAGIDPSLFFDEDGTCYYVGTRWDEITQEYSGDNEIYLQKLDLQQKKLTGERTVIWRGAMRHAIWPEGPHLYQKDGYYYLMHAEGGTEFHHSIMTARSRNILGPYEGNPCNPILTHRHLGHGFPVCNVGHGDLVETADGNWYLMMLGSRPCEGFTSLGRETFLAEVSWEEDWPVVNPGIGHLTDTVTIPLPESKTPVLPDMRYFNGEALDYDFIMLRNPSPSSFSLHENPGFLRLYMAAEQLGNPVSPSFIGMRQRSQDYEVSTEVTVKSTNDSERAGLAVVQSDEYHLRIEVYTKETRQFVCITRAEAGKDTVILEQEIAAGTVELIIRETGQKGSFLIRQEDTLIPLLENVDMRFLSTEAAGGFVGNVIGMYAATKGASSSHYADYRYFSQRIFSDRD